MAVSDSYGEIDFVEVQDQSGWQTMLSGPLTTLDISGREVDYSVKKVPTITLEEILSTHFDSPPDVMTLDVEGHELNVLKSCSWKVNKPRVIVIENCGSLRKQTTVRKFLYSKGYALYGRIWISDDVFILTET
jgi:FkbM family methyltransferase